MEITIVVLVIVVLAIILAVIKKSNHPTNEDMSTLSNVACQKTSVSDIYDRFSFDIRDIFKYSPIYQGYDAKSKAHHFVLKLKQPEFGVFSRLDIRCFASNYNVVMSSFGAPTSDFRSFIQTVVGVYGADDSGCLGLSADDEYRLSNGLSVNRSWMMNNKPAIRVGINESPGEVSCTIWGIPLTGVLPDFAKLENSHPSFLDISICGGLRDFVEKMRGKGYVDNESSDNAQKCFYSMYGKFANNDNVEIAIYYSRKTKTVSKVAVFDDSCQTWSSIKNLYFEYKQALSEKYGDVESFEFFSSPHYDGDGCELDALQADKGQFASFWDIEGGTICLRILCGLISITYEDVFGANLREQESKMTMQEYI